MDIQQYLRDIAIVLRNEINVGLPLLWRRFSATPPDKTFSVKRFLILPCDPASSTGSLGDAAMLAGLMHSLRLQHPDCCFLLIGTGSHQVDIPGVGSVDVIAAWEGWHGSLAFDDLIRQHDSFYVLGADVMDGAYGAALVCRMASYCNHAARLGIPATIVGFSFNRNPRRAAVHALARLQSEVRINVRDPRSLERFSAATRRHATLCADVAFLMHPAEESDPAIEAWIQEAHTNNRVPVGININAHAFSKVIAEMGEVAVVEAVAHELSKAAERCNLAFLLIPHDVKTKGGDIRLLQSLEQELNRYGPRMVRSILLTDPSKIKRIVGQLALVVTGRMHLAIASLGMGTPVLCVAYQDKFEGLFQHFDFPLEHLAQPQECVTDTFSIKIENAIQRLGEMRDQITKALPGVIQASERNLSSCCSPGRKSCEL